jgi:hypothetical protein
MCLKSLWFEALFFEIINALVHDVCGRHVSDEREEK